MKIFYLLSLQFIFTGIAYSQVDDINAKPSPAIAIDIQQEKYIRPRRFNRNYSWNANGLGTFGLAGGPESFLSVKMSVLGRISYDKRLRRSYNEVSLFGVYGGLELSCFGMFAIWGSAGLNAGISVGPITLDGSLTFWGIALNKEHFGTTTYNPKIGLKILDSAWLKIGPSYFLRGQNVMPNWFKINGTNINVELSYVVRIE